MRQLVLNKQTNWLAVCFTVALTNIESAADEPIGGIIEQSGKPGSIVRTFRRRINSKFRQQAYS